MAIQIAEMIDPKMADSKLLGGNGCCTVERGGTFYIT